MPTVPKARGAYDASHRGCSARKRYAINTLLASCRTKNEKDAHTLQREPPNLIVLTRSKLLEGARETRWNCCHRCASGGTHASKRVHDSNAQPHPLQESSENFPTTERRRLGAKSQPRPSGCRIFPPQSKLAKSRQKSPSYKVIRRNVACARLPTSSKCLSTCFYFFLRLFFYEFAETWTAVCGK